MERHVFTRDRMHCVSHLNLPDRCLLNSGNKILLPLFHSRGRFRMKQRNKGIKGCPRISKGIIKGIPVLTIFSIVIGNNILKIMSQLQF
jgi:hypothetical protein